jgi:hypothetical protein
MAWPLREARRHRLPQTLGPAQKALQERLGAESRENAIESVVAGNARAQRQEGAKPSFLGAAEFFHIVKVTPATEQAAHGDDHDVQQIMSAAPGHARVGEVLEMFDQTQLRL